MEENKLFKKRFGENIERNLRNIYLIDDINEEYEISNEIQDMYEISNIAFNIVRELNKNFGNREVNKILDIAKVLVQ